MSLFVQIPGGKLKYVYRSDCMVPRPNGGLTVVADMLIQNMSATQHLTELLLIYPHAFPVVAVPAEEGGEWHFAGEFKDRSLSLRDPQDPDNRLYVASGWLTATNPVEPDDHIGLNITLPDPNSPDQRVEYKGTTPCNNELRPGWYGMSELEWRVLTLIDYSIWTCHLGIPMKPEEQRWFRWELTSAPSRFHERSDWARRAEWLGGRRTFDYTISGLLSVRDRICARLQVLRSHAVDKRTVGASSTLIELLDELGLQDEDWRPNISDWRINLSPGLFARIENLTTQSIMTAGPLPNVLSYEHILDVPGLPLREQLYQWKTGEVHGVDDLRFSICFDYVFQSAWHALLPWAAILLSAAAVAIAILR